MNFCVAILILKGEEKSDSFSILYLITDISRKAKMQLKCKKRFVQWIEKVLWLIEHIKSGLRGFMLQISLNDAPQSGRPAEVDSKKIETLRMITITPYGRGQTYSKHPNQAKSSAPTR